MKKHISTEQTPENIREILRLLADTPTQLESLSRNLSDKKLHDPPGVGERSFIEDLAHLVNCEARSAEAIQLALLAKEPLLVPIHPERDLGKLLRYDLMPFDELLFYFNFRRKTLIKILVSLNDKQWSRVTREEGKKRRESVYLLSRGLVLHELDHLMDLETKFVMRSRR